MKNYYLLTVKIFSILMIVGQSLIGQNTYNFSGQVKDQDGNPLQGASVVINEKNLATITNNFGKFAFSNLSLKVFTVKVDFIGKQSYSQLIDLDQASDIAIKLLDDAFVTDEIVLTATRASEKTPIAHVNLTKADIDERNLGQDLPILMELTPSYVSTSDGGTGVGYTNMRIRGADNTGINVTMNGIPVNDAESHGVWWVNMPDLASSIEDIQIQRGVGSSTNGAGAFGATINLRTNKLNSHPYAEANLSYGSFNTQKYNLKAGSGLIADNFTFNARASLIHTDGYIDRATADLKSIYLTTSYYGENNSLIFNYINGKEVTYQAWNGVPKAYLDDEDLRTFNQYNYQNEVDDYNQVHYQLFYNQQLSDDWKMEIAGFYVKGQGFYEQYKAGEDMVDYGLNLVDANGQNLTSSDLIRQKWLDNDFWGGVYSISKNWEEGSFHIGGGINKYIGYHFGKVLKVIDANPSELNPNHEYYRNSADKKDVNFYAKVNQNLGEYFNIYADLQYRNIEYSFTGIDVTGKAVPGDDSHEFILPKAGISILPNEYTSIYLSYAKGAREPNRTDYTDNPLSQIPKSEELNDFEFGYKFRTSNFAFEANGFYMLYHNQLIATGKLNDVGNAIRVNIDKSYRAGVELMMAWKINQWIKWDANFAYSKSNISKYTEYIDDWDTWGQIAVDYENTAMAFSPEIIAASNFAFSLSDGLQLNLISKYVGDQFIDNTQNQDRKLDSYFINNVKLSYSFKTAFFEDISLSAMVNNVLNVKYQSNAWIYKYKSGDGSYDGSYGDIYSTPNGNQGYYDMAGYFPQAGTNFLLGLKIRL